MTAIGQYRHRVHVESPGPSVPDPNGGFVENWQPLDPPVWDCAIEIAAARDLEQVTGGAVVTTATHLLRGRYHAQLSPASRVLFGARVFEVQSVHDRDARQLEMLVLVRELVGQQAAAPGQAAAAQQTAGRLAPRAARARADARGPAD